MGARTRTRFATFVCFFLQTIAMVPPALWFVAVVREPIPYARIAALKAAPPLALPIAVRMRLSSACPGFEFAGAHWEQRSASFLAKITGRLEALTDSERGCGARVGRVEASIDATRRVSASDADPPVAAEAPAPAHSGALEFFVRADQDFNGSPARLVMGPGGAGTVEAPCDDLAAGGAPPGARSLEASIRAVADFLCDATADPGGRADDSRVGGAMPRRARGPRPSDPGPGDPARAASGGMLARGRPRGGLAERYRITLSLVNADPTKRRVDWRSLAARADAALQRFFSRLRPVASLTLDTQELDFVELCEGAEPEAAEAAAPLAEVAAPGSRAQRDEKARQEPSVDPRPVHVIGAEQLKRLPRAFDFHFGSSPPRGHTHGSKRLHFVLYVPPPERTPLRVRIGRGEGDASALGDALLVPGFGGLAVLNLAVGAGAPPGRSPADSDAEEPVRGRVESAVDDAAARRAVGSIVAHLRRLLGVDALRLPLRVRGRSLAAGQPSPARISARPAPSGAAGWELLLLERAQLRALNRRTAETLASLARLIESTPHMHVRSNISESVSRAVTLLEAARAAAVVDGATAWAAAADADADAGGRDVGVSPALSLARSAARHAERAYFDPDMVVQDYFPLEHLAAVFLPMLAPLAIPFSLATVYWGKRLVGPGRRCKTKAE
jgi:hypothetical protein